MSFVRAYRFNRGRPEPAWRSSTVPVEERRAIRSGHVCTGTLACRRCDAPVAAGADGLALTDELICPFCRHRGPVRDFLSLAVPTRPARVVVRLSRPAG